MWVHGNIVQAEFPELLGRRPTTQPFGDRAGFGAFFRPLTAAAGNNWFHFPMPTPVIINDVRPGLSRVFVFYNATRASIVNLHIFDGKNRIKAFDDLQGFVGDHSSSIDDKNTFLVDPPLTVFFGLGLSVQVHFFGVDPDSPIFPQIQFVTSGADFTT
jgi:hypothetical protein